MFLSTRAQLKTRAREILNQNYWLMVIAGFAVIAGQFALIAVLFAGEQEGVARYDGYGWQVQRSLWQTFSGRYGSAASLLLLLLTIAVKIFLFNPLEYGGRSCFRHISEPGAKDCLLSGFMSENYSRVVRTFLRRDVDVVLWSLLLVIPGIMKMYSHYFVPYLTEEHPELSAQEIIDLSEAMTDGRRWELFTLDLSFILWRILTSLVIEFLSALFGNLGSSASYIVNGFYVSPYWFMTQTLLYQEMVTAGMDPTRPAVHPEGV